MPKKSSSSRVLPQKNKPSKKGSNYRVKKPKIQKVSPMAEKEIKVTEIGDCCPSSDEKGTPLRPVFCLKNRDEIKKVEEIEECFILEFDPYDDLKTLKCKDSDTADLRVVAEKGQVACRDYPHPRHTCAKFPFEKTPHDSHCEMCYCYICDSSAPCLMWVGSGGHCHAFNNELWNISRTLMRQMVTLNAMIRNRRVLSRNNPSKISKMGSDYIDNKPKVQKVLRPIFCLKNRDEIKKVEKREDCFILEFDPYDDLKFSLCKDVDNADLHVVAEKGQVACRDYPHPRHTCAKYPFEKTPHDSHCEMCYCYVCDVSAPCSVWVGPDGHCHAFNNELWNFKRSVTRDVTIEVLKALKEMLMKNGLRVR